MWIQNKLKDELNVPLSWVDSNIDKSKYRKTFDVNDSSLMAPLSMKEAIANLLGDDRPTNDLDMFAAIYHSMAATYKKAIEELEDITGRKFKKVLILGGGARNVYVNKLVGEYTKKEIIARPIEATSLGNIKIQMEVIK